MENVPQRRDLRFVVRCTATAVGGAICAVTAWRMLDTDHRNTAWAEEAPIAS